MPSEWTEVTISGGAYRFASAGRYRLFTCVIRNVVSDAGSVMLRNISVSHNDMQLGLLT